MRSPFVYPIAIVAGVLAGVVFAPSVSFLFVVFLTVCSITLVIAWAPRSSRLFLIFIVALFFASFIRGMATVDSPPLSRGRLGGGSITGTVQGFPTATALTERFVIMDEEGISRTVSLRPPLGLTPGDRVWVACPRWAHGTCVASNAHTLAPATRLFLPHVLYTVRHALGVSLRNALPAPADGLAHAMTFGDRSGLTHDVRTLFTNTGTSHILAVSGMHMSVLAVMILFVLRYFPLHRAWRSMIAITLLFLFVLFVGAPASALRGFLFAVLLIIAHAVGRPRNMSMVFWSGVALLLLFRPAFLFDLGFHLSFFATMGLVYLAPFFFSFFPTQRGMNKTLRRNAGDAGRGYPHGPPAAEGDADRGGDRRQDPLLSPIFERMVILFSMFPGSALRSVGMLMTASLAATITTLPLILGTFGTVPLYGILANLIVVPLVPFIMASTAITAFVGLASSGLGALLGLIPTLLIRFTLRVLEFVAAIPGNTITTADVPPVFVGVAYAALFFCFGVLAAKRYELSDLLVAGDVLARKEL